MDACIDFLWEARIFFTLDINANYWQIDMDYKNVDETAFVSHHALFRYKMMPFGVKNAPAAFKIAANVTSASVKCQYAIVYIDDFTTFSKSRQEQVIYIEDVLIFLKAPSMTLNFKKVHFLSESINYLSHVTAT